MLSSVAIRCNYPQANPAREKVRHFRAGGQVLSVSRGPLRPSRQRLGLRQSSAALSAPRCTRGARSSIGGAGHSNPACPCESARRLAHSIACRFLVARSDRRVSVLDCGSLLPLCPRPVALAAPAPQMGGACHSNPARPCESARGLAHSIACRFLAARSDRRARAFDCGSLLPLCPRPVALA